MPNWCHNQVLISHGDAETFQRFLHNTGLDRPGRDRRFDFNAIIPIPENIPDTIPDLINSGWLDRVNTDWGCKWPPFSVELLCLERECIEIRFDTPWEPPRGIIKELVKRGFEISGVFFDDEYASCGIWNNIGSEKLVEA